MSTVGPLLKYLVKKDGMRPVYLIHFVTHACNAQCAHCLQGDVAFGRKGDLTLDEIEQLTPQLKGLVFMFLTGGEPFLREDLADIARLYHLNAGVRKFQIPSNGALTERSVRAAERMARENPDAHFGVSISLDALGEEHDRSRKIRDLFAKSTETFRKLQELERRYDNFNANVTITFSKQNEDVAREVYLYARDVLKARNIFNSLVRGQPYDPATLEVNLDRFDELNALMDEDLVNGVTRGYARFPMADFVNAKNLMSRRMISKIARERQYVSPCYAGRVSAVIYAGGDVYPCEMLDTGFGNLREIGMDFDALWFSERAETIRRHIYDDKCFCTHECFVTHNILFNPKFLPELALNVAKMKAARLLREVGLGGAPPSVVPQEAP